MLNRPKDFYIKMQLCVDLAHRASTIAAETQSTLITECTRVSFFCPNLSFSLFFPSIKLTWEKMGNTQLKLDVYIKYIKRKPLLVYRTLDQTKLFNLAKQLILFKFQLTRKGEYIYMIFQ